MSDDATRKNILAIKQFAESNMVEFRAMQKEFKILQDQVSGLKGELEQSREQVRHLQIMVYGGGATDGN